RSRRDRLRVAPVHELRLPHHILLLPHVLPALVLGGGAAQAVDGDRVQQLPRQPEFPHHHRRARRPHLRGGVDDGDRRIGSTETRARGPRAARRVRGTAVPAGPYLQRGELVVQPNVGLPLLVVTSIVIAFAVTMLSTGLNNRRSLGTALTVAAVGIAIYYPIQSVFTALTPNMN